MEEQINKIENKITQIVAKKEKYKIIVSRISLIVFSIVLVFIYLFTLISVVKVIPSHGLFKLIWYLGFGLLEIFIFYQILIMQEIREFLIKLYNLAKKDLPK